MVGTYSHGKRPSKARYSLEKVFRRGTPPRLRAVWRARNMRGSVIGTPGQFERQIGLDRGVDFRRAAQVNAPAAGRAIACEKMWLTALRCHFSSTVRSNDGRRPCPPPACNPPSIRRSNSLPASGRPAGSPATAGWRFPGPRGKSIKIRRRGRRDPLSVVKNVHRHALNLPPIGPL